MRIALLTATSRAEPAESGLAAAEATPAGLPPADVTIHTDGSATQRPREPAGRSTSSYRACLAALDAAL